MSKKLFFSKKYIFLQNLLYHSIYLSEKNKQTLGKFNNFVIKSEKSLSLQSHTSKKVWLPRSSESPSENWSYKAMLLVPIPLEKEKAGSWKKKTLPLYANKQKIKKNLYKDSSKLFHADFHQNSNLISSPVNNTALINNFFNLKNLNYNKKIKLQTIQNQKKFINFNKFLNINNKNLPYKKSFFCYWLLPFIGFISCFTTINSYLFFISNGFTKNELNHLPENINRKLQPCIPFESCKFPTSTNAYAEVSNFQYNLFNNNKSPSKTDKKLEINSANINYFQSFPNHQKISNFHSSFNNYLQKKITSNSLKELIKKLYNKYYKDLEKIIIIPENPNSPSYNSFYFNNLNSNTTNYLPFFYNNNMVPLNNLKIKESTFKAIWLNSALNIYSLSNQSKLKSNKFFSMPSKARLGSTNFVGSFPPKAAAAQFSPSKMVLSGGSASLSQPKVGPAKQTSEQQTSEQQTSEQQTSEQQTSEQQTSKQQTSEKQTLAALRLPPSLRSPLGRSINQRVNAPPPNASQPKATNSKKVKDFFLPTNPKILVKNLFLDNQYYSFGQKLEKDTYSTLNNLTVFPSFSGEAWGLCGAAKRGALGAKHYPWHYPWHYPDFSMVKTKNFTNLDKNINITNLCFLLEIDKNFYLPKLLNKQISQNPIFSFQTASILLDRLISPNFINNLDNLFSQNLVQQIKNYLLNFKKSNNLHKIMKKKNNFNRSTSKTKVLDNNIKLPSDQIDDIFSSLFIFNLINPKVNNFEFYNYKKNKINFKTNLNPHLSVNFKNSNINSNRKKDTNLVKNTISFLIKKKIQIMQNKKLKQKRPSFKIDFVQNQHQAVSNNNKNIIFKKISDSKLLFRFISNFSKTKKIYLFGNSNINFKLKLKKLSNLIELVPKSFYKPLLSQSYLNNKGLNKNIINNLTPEKIHLDNENKNLINLNIKNEALTKCNKDSFYYLVFNSYFNSLEKIITEHFIQTKFLLKKEKFNSFKEKIQILKIPQFCNSKLILTKKKIIKKNFNKLKPLNYIEIYKNKLINNKPLGCLTYFNNFINLPIYHKTLGLQNLTKTNFSIIKLNNPIWITNLNSSLFTLSKQTKNLVFDSLFVKKILHKKKRKSYLLNSKYYLKNKINKIFRNRSSTLIFTKKNYLNNNLKSNQRSDNFLSLQSKFVKENLTKKLIHNQKSNFSYPISLNEKTKMILDLNLEKNKNLITQFKYFKKITSFSNYINFLSTKLQQIWLNPNNSKSPKKIKKKKFSEKFFSNTKISLMRAGKRETMLVTYPKFVRSSHSETLQGCSSYAKAKKEFKVRKKEKIYKLTPQFIQKLKLSKRLEKSLWYSSFGVGPVNKENFDLKLPKSTSIFSGLNKKIIFFRNYKQKKNNSKIYSQKIVKNLIKFHKNNTLLKKSNKFQILNFSDKNKLRNSLNYLDLKCSNKKYVIKQNLTFKKKCKLKKKQFNSFKNVKLEKIFRSYLSKKVNRIKLHEVRNKKFFLNDFFNSSFSFKSLKTKLINKLILKPEFSFENKKKRNVVQLIKDLKHIKSNTSLISPSRLNKRFFIKLNIKKNPKVKKSFSKTIKLVPLATLRTVPSKLGLNGQNFVKIQPTFLKASQRRASQRRALQRKASQKQSLVKLKNRDKVVSHRLAAKRPSEKRPSEKRPSEKRPSEKRGVARPTKGSLLALRSVFRRGAVVLRRKAGVLRRGAGGQSKFGFHPSAVGVFTLGKNQPSEAKQNHLRWRDSPQKHTLASLRLPEDTLVNPNLLLKHSVFIKKIYKKINIFPFSFSKTKENLNNFLDNPNLLINPWKFLAKDEKFLLKINNQNIIKRNKYLRNLATKLKINKTYKSLLLKNFNEKFLKKENNKYKDLYENSINLSLNTKKNKYLSRYLSKLDKEKYNQRKYRKHKRRQEIGRGRKREHSFRPEWFSDNLYLKFLKLRHFEKQKSLIIKRQNFKKIFFNNPKFFQFYSNLTSANNIPLKHANLTGTNKFKNSYKISNLNLLGLRSAGTTKLYKPEFLENKNENKLKMVFNSRYFSFFANNNFYVIPRPILRDLKKLFWKSSWFRSSLNPYLNRIKNYLTDIKKSTKTYYLNLSIKNFFLQESSFRNLSKREIKNQEDFWKFSLENLKVKNNSNFKFNNLNLYGNINIKNYLQNQNYLNSTLSKNWQITTNFTEYQRIIFERIQQAILNIKKNLKLNGHPKAHPSKIGHRKLRKKKSVEKFFIKFGKINPKTMKKVDSRNFYANTSKVRMMWTLNKTNLAYLKFSNQNAWINYRWREQTKNNKTKKIMYKMRIKLNNLLSEKSLMTDKENQISNFNFTQILTIKPFFNKFLEKNLSSNFILEKISENNKNNLNEINYRKLEEDINSFQHIDYTKGIAKLKRSLSSYESKLRKKETKLSFFFNKKTNKFPLKKHEFRDLKKQVLTKSKALAMIRGCEARGSGGLRSDLRKSDLRKSDLRKSDLRKSEGGNLSAAKVTGPTFGWPGYPIRAPKGEAYPDITLALPLSLPRFAELKFSPSSTMKTKRAAKRGPPMSETSLRHKKLKIGLPVNKKFNIKTFLSKSFLQKNTKSLKLQLVKPTYLNVKVFNKFTHKYNYWWNSFSLHLIPEFKNMRNFSLSTNKNHIKSVYSNDLIVWISTFLFHFCALLFLINSSEIRELIKFSIIVFSNIFKIYLGIAFKVYDTVVEYSNPFNYSYIKNNLNYFSQILKNSISIKEKNKKIKKFYLNPIYVNNICLLRTMPTKDWLILRGEAGDQPEVGPAKQTSEQQTSEQQTSEQQTSEQQTSEQQTSEQQTSEKQTSEKQTSKEHNLASLGLLSDLSFAKVCSADQFIKLNMNYKEIFCNPFNSQIIQFFMSSKKEILDQVNQKPLNVMISASPLNNISNKLMTSKNKLKTYNINFFSELIYLSFLSILTKILLHKNKQNLLLNNKKIISLVVQTEFVQPSLASLGMEVKPNLVFIQPSLSTFENLNSSNLTNLTSLKEKQNFSFNKSKLFYKKLRLFPISLVLFFSKNKNLLKNINKKKTPLTKYYLINLLKFTLSLWYKGLFFLYQVFVKSLDLLNFTIGCIYLFFEKPGELVLEWFAYAFLVQWSSDGIRIIPDVADNSRMQSFLKISRGIRPFFMTLVPRLNNSFLFSLSFLFSGLLQRRILIIYETIFRKWYELENDLSFREKKGIIFWDLWAEALLEVAEDSNINLSELTSLKEEQNRLLEKLEEYGLEDSQENILNLTNKFSKIKKISKFFEKKKVNQSKNINKNFNIIQRKPYYFFNNNYFLNYSPYKNEKIKNLTFKKTLTLINETKLTPLHSFPKDMLGGIDTTFETQLQKNWSVDQFLSYQGKGTELFIQKSPSKSFLHIPSIKYSTSSLQPIGTIVCQVFSGLFNREIAKNILVIGSSFNSSRAKVYSAPHQNSPTRGLLVKNSPAVSLTNLRLTKNSNVQNFKKLNKYPLEKLREGQCADGSNVLETKHETLFIQAIAGETELKIITDNAHRYSMTYSGVAIGIKLLKDVFEALSSQTPCIFLLEDIHHIGVRRPFLISDETELTKDEEFSPEKEETHEKDQVIYELSKHLISHYKKPYKGDSSLLIPTNHFCFNLFLGVSSPQIRNNLIPLANSLNSNSSTEIKDLSSNSKDENNSNSSEQITGELQNNSLATSLQIKSNSLLAPPATSPFSVLVLKQDTKLNPKQVVKEIPWSGFTVEKLALISKSNYSIRVKIALLADIALSNVSVKLDMITDLLVIIDSVRGNRGFIVFATTNIPYILDPALRRPGRFDETISLPLIPNLFSRWEILKTNLQNLTKSSPYSSFFNGLSVDFTNIQGLFNSTHNLSKFNHKCLTFNTKIKFQKNISIQNNFNHKNLVSNYLTLTYHLNNTTEQFIYPFQIKNYLFKKNLLLNKNLTVKKIFTSIKNVITLPNQNSKNYYSKIFINMVARTYFYISQILTSFSLQENSSFQKISSNFIHSKLKTKLQKKEKKLFTIPPTDFVGFDSSIYLSLYTSKKNLKKYLTQLMSGKLGELFIFPSNNYKSNSKSYSKTNNFIGTTGLMNLYGIDKTCRSATSLLFSLITKRYIYNTNLIIPKLLHFSNYSSLHDVPTPPASNILLPLKRYENYRKTFYTEQIKNKANFQGKTLQVILELHQQQRFIKRLYNLPLREFFRSEIINDKLTGFSNSLITLSPIEKTINFSTNINWYYRNRILNRHKNYLNNQWWNGQLTEHSAESTFSSDVDWRSTFVESIGDIFIDFPDSDQFYHVKNRRWMLTSNGWENWFSFEKTNLDKIFNQYMLDCFMEAYNSLDQYREILDFYAFTSLNQCMLKEFKEITTINLFKRLSNCN